MHDSAGRVFDLPHRAIEKARGQPFVHFVRGIGVWRARLPTPWVSLRALVRSTAGGKTTYRATDLARPSESKGQPCTTRIAVSERLFHIPIEWILLLFPREGARGGAESFALRSPAREAESMSLLGPHPPEFGRGLIFPVPTC